MKPRKLSRSFYEQSDVVETAQKLLGKKLCSRIGEGPLTSGIITEAEAYCGRNDRACHANDGRRTERTEVMYRRGGVAYVYLCYGIHNMFNVVTNREGTADAVLIRAVEPVDGIETMLARRRQDTVSPRLTAGPGRLTEALGITREHYGIDLTGDVIWIEKSDLTIPGDRIAAGKRIGVDYAGEHAKRPWRFYLKGSNWIS